MSHRPLLLLPVLLGAPLAGAEDLGTLLRRAREARDAGRWTEALAAYDAMLAQIPAHETALFEKARTLAWAGRHEEAVAAFARFRTSYPSRALDADLGAAQANAWNGQFKPAFILLGNWARQGQRQAVLDQALYQAWEGRTGAAVTELDAWLSTYTKDREARLLRARFLAWAGRLTEARQGYEAILVEHPGDGETMLALARLQLWRGDSTGAQSRLAEAPTENRESPEGRILAAQIDTLEGRPKAARQRLRPLATGGPAQREARELLGEMAEATGPWAELSSTRTDTSEYLRSERWSLAARLPLGNVYGDLGVARNRVTLGEATPSTKEISLGLAYPLLSVLAFRGTVQHLSDLGGTPATAHSLGLRWRAFPGLSLNVAASRSLAVYTPASVTKRIAFQALEADLAWTFGDGRRTLTVAGGKATLSAGSTRNHLAGALEQRWPVLTGQFKAGLLARSFGYSDSLPLGFFNPEKYRYAGATTGFEVRRGRRWSAGLDVRGGWQKVNEDPKAFTWSYGLNLSCRPHAGPLAFFLAWGAAEAGLPVVDPTDLSTYKEHTLRFGLRLTGSGH